ncbi:MAG: CBS domain-containing protein [Betaproteobacteria bacterium]
MFDQAIKTIMEQKKFLTAPPHATVSEAAKSMAGKNAGAVMVVEENKLIGIFTERDVVFRVVAKGLDPKLTPLRDVMTADPKTLSSGKSYGHAMLLMHENGFRHVPVMEDARPVGIISSRNAMDPDLEEFVAEVRRREHHRA